MPAELAGWRLLRLLGRGSHGSVYAAQAAAGGGTVALKVVRLPAGAQAGSAAQVFLDVARVAQRLRHPGIVAALDAGVAGAYAWLAMELVPGHDLTRHTSPGQLLPPDQVLLVAERLAQALAHAHRHGVVHRDLKPANVLVDWAAGIVRLADFGLARAGDALQTGTGVVPGSPAYMAPEQLAGGVPTVQTDFYALGVLLFQLLSGRLPFETHSMGELLRQVAHDPAPDLRTLRPDVPVVLGALVARLLAKQAAQRPADGELLATELRSIRQALAAGG